MGTRPEAVMDSRAPLILLTGATGYIGGRLQNLLERRGDRIRCLARRPEELRPRVGTLTEVVPGDALRPQTLAAAFEGVDTAYYLIHSMGSARDFESEERRAAENFAAAAGKAGVRRIIYLGGLGNPEHGLSSHLQSRQETGRILRESGVQVIEFRASIIIGSGSLSFEIIRALTERLPVLICPRWVATPAQPIAVEDVLDYLLAALDLDAQESRVFEIGGPAQVSYGELMQQYARLRGLRRVMIPVPVLTPGLSSLWLGLVTPVYARIGRKLIEGLRSPTVVEDPSALEAFPIRPRGLSEAIGRALSYEDRRFAETRWSDALSSSGPASGRGGVRFGSRIVESLTAAVDAPPAAAFALIERIGGPAGWYCCNWLWRLRGAIDLLAGGTGMRRGRRDPHSLLAGDVVDFWRVEAFEQDRLLRLRAEMKLPGRAWLEFEVTDNEQPAKTYVNTGGFHNPWAPRSSEAIHGSERTGQSPLPSTQRCIIRQTALFDPIGLSGLAYWYLLYPIHRIVFAGLLRGLVRRAEAER